MYFGGVRKVVPKTASYTIKLNQPDRSGTLFTTAGAGGAVTFTLPAPRPAIAGTVFEFYNEVGQNMIVSAGAAGGIAFNNASCASLAAQTGGQLIGAKIRATVNPAGTRWLLEGTTLGVTYTVA